MSGLVLGQAHPGSFSTSSSNPAQCRRASRSLSNISNKSGSKSPPEVSDESERRRSIDDLTGKPQRSSVKSTHAYINDAFSFLKTDEYNPYNFYQEESKSRESSPRMSESEPDEASGPNTSPPPSPMRSIPEENLDIWKERNSQALQEQEKHKTYEQQQKPQQQKRQQKKLQQQQQQQLNVPKSHPNLASSSHVTNSSNNLTSSTPVIGRNVVPHINTRTMSQTRNTPPVSQTRSIPTISQTLPPSKDEYAKLRRNKILLLVLLVLIVGGAIVIGLAIGITSLSSQEKVTQTEPFYYSGEITYDMPWSSQLLIQSSSEYTNLVQDITKHIQKVFDDSEFGSIYVGTEVTGFRSGSVICDFKLKMAAQVTSHGHVVTERALQTTLRTGFDVLTKSEQLTWPVLKIAVTGADTDSSSPASTDTTWFSFDVTERPRVTDEPAQCESLLANRCVALGYTHTGFPNKFGSRNHLEAAGIANELLATERDNCYSFVENFMCAVVYPKCADGRLIEPCQSFCKEFSSACNYPITCSLFYDDDDPAVCVPKMIADQVPTVVYPQNPCPSSMFRCDDDTCIQESQKCDGRADCRNWDDEILPECSQTSSLDCTFGTESGSSTLCMYSQRTDDHFDWTRQKGSTPSTGTGPDWDHTVRNKRGYYLLAEASGRYPGDKARLQSKRLSQTRDYCLRFYYYMYGAQVDNLEVLFLNDNSEETLQWQRSRDQGKEWLFAAVTIPKGAGHVIFQATRGSGYQGDIAIDDVTLREGACPQQGCEEDKFSCINGNCIRPDYVCNSENDCGDYSDERNCNCTEDQYQCSMGMCIMGWHRCEGQQHCPDGTDELLCDCPFDQYQCSDGTCIMREWLCDRQTDCASGEDEHKHICGACSSDEFQCKDYSCVPISHRCDGVSHCQDNSDEQLCVQQRDDLIVEVYVTESRMYLPLCYDGFLQNWDADVCATLGKGHLASRTSVNLTGTEFAAVTDRKLVSEDPLYLRVHKRSLCSDGGGALAVQCNDIVCGKMAENHNPSQYIIHGKNADQGEWPWVVAITFDDELNCGGALISPYHIITAAHCVGAHRFYPNRFMALLGSVDRRSTGEHLIVHRVRKITMHEDFEIYYKGDDIAVFVLEVAVTYSEHVRPLCLPQIDEHLPASAICYTGGWGYMNHTLENSADILQEAKMQLWTNEECKHGHPFINADMVCAGYQSGYISSCLGDSGSPLMCMDEFQRWKLVGVFSFIAVGCNVPLRPPVFTRVTSYLGWIQDKLDCTFICDNGKCLLDDKETCDGVDNCGDYSDELKPCKPSATCDFEDRFKCGYTSPQDLKFPRWSRESGQPKHGKSSGGNRRRITDPTTTGQNQGPTTDNTRGTTAGSYMYASQNQAILLSPVNHLQGPHCLVFHLHMRKAVNAGALRVSISHVTDDALLAHQVELANRSTVFLNTETTGDKWFREYVDVPSGDYVIGFEAIATSGRQDPGIAIDDIQLLAGECQVQGCEADETRCTSGDQCYKSAERCNYHTHCDTDQSDEANCQGQLSYSCDFEMYGACALEQDDKDTFDWLPRVVDQQSFNAPDADHTTGTGHHAGHFLYLDTRQGAVGDTGRLSLRVHPQPGPSCFTLYYNMLSNGSLAISFESVSAGLETPLRFTNTDTSDWLKASITMPTDTTAIIIDGIIGSRGDYVGANYITIDDMSIAEGSCDGEECGGFMCSNGDCIPTQFLCDNSDDCGDGSDELNCNIPVPTTTTESPSQGSGCEDKFICADGSNCISKTMYCDGFADCPDLSDEPENCVCNEAQFRCNSTSSCIGLDRFCDGIPNCLEAEDEPADCQCRQDQYRCTHGGCVSSTLLCDRVPDCVDFSDESVCASMGVETCFDGEFQCANGLCIPETLHCNGVFNCADRSDELHDCPCSEDEKRCANGLCLGTQYWCNGMDDCQDESDETDPICNSVCQVGEVMCGDEETCIINEWVCDGSADCHNGWDENSCVQCRSDEFACSTVQGSQCVPLNTRCDGEINCPDGQDEANCVRLSKEEDSLDVLEKMDASGNWYPVCDLNWILSWSEDICEIIGQGPSQRTSSHLLTNAVTYFVVQSSQPNYSHSLLQPSTGCPGNAAVKILCEPKICGTVDSSVLQTAAHFVVGGTPAPEGAWPWMAGLYYLGLYRCGAVLIDNQFVLSAAHCFFTDQGIRISDLTNYFTVLLGTSTQSRVGESHTIEAEVESVTLHPQYRATAQTTNKDMAVIKFKSPVPNFTVHIRPICLPDPSHLFNTRQVCYITGWGHTFPYYTPGQSPDDLRQAKYNLWSDEDCGAEDVWGATFNSSTHLCGGYASTSISSITACFGDSGSPLVCRDANDRWHLAGITSIGPYNCGSTNSKPTVFTRVQEYEDWIYDITGNMKR